MQLFAERRTVTPRSRNGKVESLRVLKVCRKTAVQARRIALQGNGHPAIDGLG